MRIVTKNIEKTGEGRVVLVPEHSEDLWHLYNIIVVNDRVHGTTIRKVVRELALGATQSFTKQLRITLAVKSIDYDGEGDELRVSGTNVTESQWIELGEHHTLKFKVNDQLGISKGRWDFLALERLSAASNISASAETAVLLMDMGVANLFLLSRCLAKDLAKVSVVIPKNRGIVSNHDKAVDRFYRQTATALRQHVPFDSIKCILVAGPGFVKDEFLKWLWTEAKSLGVDGAMLLSHKALFVSARCSTAYKPGLNELLADENVKKRLQSTQASRHVSALDQFYKMLRREPTKVCYGPKEVAIAVEHRAVQTLLLAEQIFRSTNVKTRLQYSRLVETVKQSGGEVLIFSEQHVSGQQLAMLAGVAAILKYALLELENDDDYYVEPEEGQDDTEAPDVRPASAGARAGEDPFSV